MIYSMPSTCNIHNSITRPVKPMQTTYGTLTMVLNETEALNTYK